MIFYGTRSSNLKNGKIKNVSCPHCTTDTDMNYSVFGKYAHVYWIPFFPIGRTNIVECNDCKSTYDLKNLDETVKQKFKKEQDFNPVKTPIWFFSGLFIIATITMSVMYYDNKQDDDEKVFIKNPKVGDLYHFKASEGFYSCMKVQEVTKDSVFCLANNMETNQETGIDDINVDKNYSLKTIWSYSKKELVESMKDEEFIYQIDRN
jgi:hypothetical protein